MKFEKKEILKAFLPMLLDILKGILAYLRSHKMSDDNFNDHELYELNF